jgi:oligopeptide/dipeptide ABC transporter ATP-binding protein
MNALEAINLSKNYSATDGFFIKNKKNIRAVNDISFTLKENQTLGIVGESGCGKSTLARMLVGLLQPTSGTINLQDKNINQYQRQELGRVIQYVFQDPLSSLNPRKTIYQSLAAPLKYLHQHDNSLIKEKMLSVMGEVGLKEEFLDRYPHEFSGGQAQRIGIARALLADAKILILDEPVSALDVSIQSQVLNLLNDLKRKFKLSFIVISHDLAVVENISDEIAVMYFGDIVEHNSSKEIFQSPHHPYTELLVGSVPTLNKQFADIQTKHTELPDPANPPSGCSFYSRCNYRSDKCQNNKTPINSAQKTPFVSCFHPL